MASQIVVKSQIVNNWGGRTIWVVQDMLVDYMRERTGLRLDELESPDWQTGEVNVLAANLNDPDDLQPYAGPVQSKDGEACWAELLETPEMPNIEILESKLDEKKTIASLVVP